MRVGTLWVDADYTRDAEDKMSRNWQEFIVLGIFVLLLAAATLANVSDGSLYHLRGAWVAQAMR
jgi:hypothetical protein